MRFPDTGSTIKSIESIHAPRQMSRSFRRHPPLPRSVPVSTAVVFVALVRAINHLALSWHANAILTRGVRILNRYGINDH